MLKATIFELDTLDGKELAGACAAKLRERGIEVIERKQFKKMDCIRAILSDDLVFLDASREAERHNYRQFSQMAIYRPHVFICSRSYLPFNFQPIHPGGAAPEWYPQRKSNKEILQSLFGPVSQGGPEPAVDDFLNNKPERDPRSVAASGFKQIRENLAYVKGARHREILRRKKQGEIFISFRGKYFQAVQELDAQVQAAAAPGSAPTFRYYPPGGLSSLIMSEQMRWSLLSMIGRHIAPAREFWIYDTPDYFDSWWTTGNWPGWSIVLRRMDVARSCASSIQRPARYVTSIPAIASFLANARRREWTAIL
jgi:hypothetical protein